MDDPLTIGHLTKSLMNLLNLSKEEAKQKSELIMDIFGYEDRIEDNHLSNMTRKFFYYLERERVVVAERDYYDLPERDRPWVIYFWRINKDLILCYSRMKKDRSEKIAEVNIYLSLRESVWRSRKIVSRE
jgi:hypothetical protein